MVSVTHFHQPFSYLNNTAQTSIAFLSLYERQAQRAF